jgi:uncharacterized membrane protein/thiol-disulfide isomerase/thioredoxin
MKYWLGLMLLVVCLLFLGNPSPAQADGPVVRAILFYSPSCPHCHIVIEEVVLPLLEQYDDQLEVIGADTSTPVGQVLFQSAIERFNIPPERQAVPLLIIDDVILLGSVEIPQRFPPLVEMYLAQGGVDWPDIPALIEALQVAEIQPTSSPEPVNTSIPVQTTGDIPSTSQLTEGAPAETIIPEPTPSKQVGLILTEDPPSGVLDRLARDPLGNSLAILVLIGMLISVGGAVMVLLSPGDLPKPSSRNPGTPNPGSPKAISPSLAIPVITLIGIVIAAYMSYVETTHVTAVCGPVGDCNTVQQSEYARLFGILPIGVLGLVGYIAILLTWMVVRFGSGRNVHLASLALLTMTLVGTLFSIYLTFLEPFVIGATCAWCLSSAIIMTVLLWLAIAPGKLALRKLDFAEAHDNPRKHHRRSAGHK